MKNPFIESERLYFRPLDFNDLNGNYVNWLNDEDVSKGNSHRIMPYTLDLAKSYIENAYVSTDKLILAIVLKENDIHIGNISLQSINYLHQNAEFAILLGEKKYWGKGYSKEASYLLVKFGFQTLNLNRIFCGTFSENMPMIKLAEYLGMKKEGLRRNAFYKNGKFIDIVEFGLLKQEFFAKFQNEGK
jgi:RimJ/RimL family protein N-acetyltransferase